MDAFWKVDRQTITALDLQKQNCQASPKHGIIQMTFQTSLTDKIGCEVWVWRW